METSGRPGAIGALTQLELESTSSLEHHRLLNSCLFGGTQKLQVNLLTRTGNAGGLVAFVRTLSCLMSTCAVKLSITNLKVCLKWLLCSMFFFVFEVVKVEGTVRLCGTNVCFF